MAALAVAPLALVVTEEEEDDDAYKCPVCVEKMGAEYRIQGEKPDVIPECGHSIHHVNLFSFLFSFECRC